jgi:hypothetical protein
VWGALKAETTLLGWGLVVSTLDFTDLLLVGVEAFLLTIDFFSIAICGFSIFYLTALRNTLVQADCQTFYTRPQDRKVLKTLASRRLSSVRPTLPFAYMG